MRRLKAEFHAHTSDDPRDEIAHSAEMLIDSMAERGYDVLSITCHHAVAHDSSLAEYARQRGILLIPGIEVSLDGAHVLIINPDPEQTRASTFDELRRLGRRDALIIAPHPYFPADASLGRRLIENIDLFDAIEYSAFYTPFCNFNRKAARVAQTHGIPLIGNTDTHVLPFEDSTFTWIDSEPAIPSVVEAVRNGRVDMETRPRSYRQIGATLSFTAAQALRDIRNRNNRREALS